MNRSENVFRAKRTTRENYRLYRICARATREMHAGTGRIEESTIASPGNDHFACVAGENAYD